MEKQSTDVIQVYLNDLTRRNYSDETVVKYRQVLRQFESFCISSNVPVEEASKSQIKEFRESLSQKEFKNVSINGYTNILKAFFEYLKAFLRPDNPARRFQKVREAKLLPSNVIESELLRLLDSIDKDPTLNVTDTTMFEVLLGTGIRVSEMCDLDIVDIEEWGRVPTPEEIDAYEKKNKHKDNFKPLTWIAGLLHIRKGKGNVARKVPIPKETEMFLKRYLQVREDQNFNSPFLFCNLSGGRLNRGNVYKKIKPFLDLTNSPKKGPHTLRHTYASILINRGADIAAIKDLLGHQSVKTTEKYTHLEMDAMKAIFDKAHPKS